MGHAAGPFGGPAIGTAGLGSPWATTPSENVVINNYYDHDESRVRGADDNARDSFDAGVQDADDSSDGSDGGGGGGGGDWA